MYAVEIEHSRDNYKGEPLYRVWINGYKIGDFLTMEKVLERITPPRDRDKNNRS